PLPPCTTLQSLHQALPLNDTHFCDKTNNEADCGPGFRSSHKNTAKNKMRSSHKNTANYDQDSSHKNTVPHRPYISCRHSLSPLKHTHVPMHLPFTFFLHFHSSILPSPSFPIPST